MGAFVSSDSKAYPFVIFFVRCFWIIALLCYLFEYALPLATVYWGTPAKAQISKLWINPPEGRKRSYFVQVEYMDGVQQQTRAATVDPVYYSKLSMGQTIDIHYFADKPLRPAFDASHPSLSLNLGFLCVFVILFLGFFSSPKAKKKPEPISR